MEKHFKQLSIRLCKYVDTWDDKLPTYQGSGVTQMINMNK